MSLQDNTLDQAAYRPLLDTIAKGESAGNYNAYYGSAGNETIKFTDMTLQQVLAWQDAYVASGSASSAVGRYQIIRPTLAGLIKQLNLPTTTVFDEKLQDRLAVTLIERRGAVDYINQRIDKNRFAANLAQEWAALPRVIGSNPSESYYSGDGINAARIPLSDIFKGIDQLEKP